MDNPERDIPVGLFELFQKIAEETGWLAIGTDAGDRREVIDTDLDFGFGDGYRGPGQHDAGEKRHQTAPDEGHWIQRYAPSM